MTRLLPLSVALICAAALAYQILLMRMLSIAHWQPFAALIISLALLGHGVSGSVLSVAGARAVQHFERLYPASAAAFAFSALACHVLAQRLPFNGLELAWNPAQFLWLSALYLLLMLPFFFAASCVGLAFLRHPARVPSLYAADLLGAGLGAAGLIGLLWILPPEDALCAVAAAGLLAAALAIPGRHGAWFAGGAGLAFLLMTLPASWLQPRESEFKGLPRALLIQGTEVISRRSSPYGNLSVVRSPAVPLRHTPGLSLRHAGEPATQLGVFTDGDALNIITAFDGHMEPLRYLGAMTSALPYQLLNEPRVLVLNANGGAEVLQALLHDAAQVKAVEPNPQRLELVRDEYAEFAGRLYRHPRVSVEAAEARGFVRGSREQYDLVVLPLGDSLAGSGAGALAASEGYSYTVEALADYYAHLAPGGLLAITRWEKLPPRDSLKLFATAVAALRAAGVSEPELQLAAIRNWDVSTVIVKNGVLTDADLAALRAFCERHGFDPAYYPGMPALVANRYNHLERPYLFEGAQALLGPQARQYLEDYKFHIAPARDDTPHFFHFFKWRVLPELLALRGQGGVVLLDSGYLLLAAALAQALPLSLLLVLLPLAALKRPTPAPPLWQPGAYFLCLGLAFLFIEIACLQGLTLLIGHPLLSAAAGIAGFLVFAGLGSASAGWLRQRFVRPALAAVGGIVLGAVLYLVLYPWLLDWTATAPVTLRALVAVALIAPMAFFMGAPFPLGLLRLADAAPRFIPWAWGLNGCASVLSAILAALLSVHFGFTTVILAALALYLAAAYLWKDETP